MTRDELIRPLPELLEAHAARATRSGSPSGLRAGVSRTGAGAAHREVGRSPRGGGAAAGVTEWRCCWATVWSWWRVVSR